MLRPDDLPRVTRRRALSELVWPIEGAPSERERLRALAWLSTSDRASGRARSRARTAGSAASTRALAAFRRPTRLTDPACSSRSRSRVDVRRHRAGGVRRLLVDLVRRADARPEARWTPRSTRACAARSPTRRSSGSSPACRSGSAPSRSRPTGSTRRSRSCASAWTRRSPAGRRARLELTDLQRERAAPGALARPGGARPRGGGVGAPARPAPVRGLVRLGALGARAPARPRPRARSSSRGRSTASTSTRSRRAGSSGTTSRARRRTRAAEIERELKLQIPLYMLVLRDLVGVEPLGGLYRPLSGDRKARGLLRASARDGRRARLLARRLRRRGGLLGEGRARAGRGRAGSSRGSARATCRHDPREGSCPSVVQARLDVPGEEGRSDGARRPSARRLPSSTPRSRPRGSSSSPPARARARRPCSSSASPVRSTAASTSARSSSSPTPSAPPPSCARASARGSPSSAGRELTRELDGAWISTIHGFCLRLLKQHPFAAGLDPRFRVLDESQAAVLRVEAFDEALAEFCRGGAADRLALLATYGSAALRRMLTGVYETLRAAGRPLELPLGDAPGRSTRRASRSCAAIATGPRGSSSCSTAGRRLESLLDLSGFAVKGDDDYEQARQGARAGGAERASPRATARCSRSCSRRFERSYQAAKDRESALDFEDLQLRARDLLARRRRDPRARAAALPPGLRRRVPGHEPAPVRADRPDRPRRALLRRRRVPVDLPLPPRRRRGVQGAARGRSARCCR